MSLSSNNSTRMDTKTITSLAMLTALAYIVMLMCKSLPQVSGFLQFDLTDTVICIGGFIFGPMSAAIISILIGLLDTMSDGGTGPIGMLMNIISSASFSCTASYIYKRRHTKNGAVVSLAVAVAVMTAVMLLWNFLITPIYQKVPRDVVAAMLPTVFLPFNAVKGGLNMALTLLLYKPIVNAMRGAHLAPPSKSSHGKKMNGGMLLFAVALLITFGTLALVLADVI